MSSYYSTDLNEQTFFDWTGKTLNKKYILLKKLGSGSFSVVWMAINQQKKNLVAIKIHNTQDFDAGEKEAKLHEKIKSRNCKYIVNYIESFVHPYFDDSDEKHFCIVLELMACSLYDVIKDGKYKNGLPVDACISIIKQCLIALKELNKIGYIHTDIKPENILLEGISEDNKNIIDFISSKKFDECIKNYKKKIINESKAPNKKKMKGLNETAIEFAIKDFFNSTQNCNNDQYSDNDNHRIHHNFNFRFSRQDIESDFSSNDNESNSTFCDYSLCPVSENIINNCKVKLTDLGTCLFKKDIEKNFNFDIQTRYYRSPEVMLKCEYSENCDIWSLGCTFYEILTGEILFDPNDLEDNISKDRFHLCDIQKKIDILPWYIIKDSPLYDLYFRKNGLLKGVNKFIPEPIFINIEQKINNKCSKQVNNNIINFIQCCLILDQKKRYNTHNCLIHPLFLNT